MLQWSRREWLEAILVPAALCAAGGAAAAAQLPTQFFDANRVCDINTKLTPTAPLGANFKANAPERTSFLDAGVTGTKLVLAGQVVGIRCGLIKGARIDFWQADARGQLDAGGFRFRGAQRTDEQGRYKLDTVIPGADANHARVIHAKVTPPTGAPLTMQLFVADDADAKRAPGYAPELVLALTDGPDGKRAKFDFILDL